MREARIYQEALDIATGDLITTSYGTGPYEVWSIYGPRYTSTFPGVLFVRTWPVISLTLIKPGTKPRRGYDCDFFWINDIRQEADRWFTDGCDEVFVVKSTSPPALPVDMFQSFPPTPAPYPFDPAVDYHVGSRAVWRCEPCLLDFNARRPVGNPACPRCGWPCCDEVVLLPPRDVGAAVHPSP